MLTHEETSTGWIRNLDRDGFAVIPDALQAAAVSELIDALNQTDSDASAVRQRGQETYAIRNLLKSVPAVHALATSPVIRSPVEAVLGSSARCVRGLLFDKTADANWKVAWHQDLTIAVEQRVDVPGFGPWSIKAGVEHVQPPVEILERMLTLRLHLDDCDEMNGPLQVLPGSHLAGKFSAKDIQAWRNRASAVTCAVNRGEILLMRPLLLHASSPAKTPAHRRVIHLEFAAEALPGGLNWLTTCYKEKA
jgi:ectoine hydroxylase-related dioxygenase (phytanoyl-CoA dioxygenase family)